MKEHTAKIKGVIGYETFNSELALALQDVRKGDETTIEIDSPGGSVTEGLSMFNTIKNTPGKKTIEIVGSCMSIASLVALAGDFIKSSQASLLMYHRASIGPNEGGNSEDLERQKQSLVKIDQLLIDLYFARNKAKGKMKLTREDIESMLSAETFLTPGDALEYGWVDEVTDLIDERIAAVASLKDIILLRKHNFQMKHLDKLRKLLNLSAERPTLTDVVIKDSFIKALKDKNQKAFTKEELVALTLAVTSAAKEFVGADELTAEESALVTSGIQNVVNEITAAFPPKEEEEEEEEDPKEEEADPDEEEEKKKKEEEEKKSAKDIAELKDMINTIAKALHETSVENTQAFNTIREDITNLRKGTRTFGKKPFVNESTKINLNSTWQDPHVKHREMMKEIDEKTRPAGRITKH